MLDTKFFIKVGPNIRDRYREHIFKKAKDINGKSFSKIYSKGYAKRKKAGGKGFRGGFPFNAPVASGDLLKDYSLIKTMSNGFQIGWSTFGARVEWLANLGRVLTTSAKPLPNKVLKFLIKEANTYIKKKSDKLIPKKTTIHKIGKK